MRSNFLIKKPTFSLEEDWIDSLFDSWGTVDEHSWFWYIVKCIEDFGWDPVRQYFEGIGDEYYEMWEELGDILEEELTKLAIGHMHTGLPYLACAQSEIGILMSELVESALTPSAKHAIRSGEVCFDKSIEDIDFFFKEIVSIYLGKGTEYLIESSFDGVTKVDWEEEVDREETREFSGNVIPFPVKEPELD